MSLLLTFFVIFITSCTQSPDVNQVLKNAVSAHGGEQFDQLEVTFDFRGTPYRLIKDGGKFRYERTRADSSGNKILEGMDNNGAYKLINGIEQSITSREDSLLKYSINAVRYFAVLPLQLINKAVVPEYIGSSEILGKKYHKIEITFRSEGGGSDYQDRYIFWFEQDTYRMDYFAYYYHVNGGGSRFRKVVNTRNFNGILLSDQINYTSEKISTNIEDYDKEFLAGNLKEVSQIKLENLKVEKF